MQFKQIGIERHFEFQRKEFKEIVLKETNNVVQKMGLKKKDVLLKQRFQRNCEPS